MHRLLLYKNLELFEPLKILFFGLQRIQPHPSREIINEGKKIPYTTHGCGLYTATYIGMHDFQKIGRLHPLRLKK